MKNAERIQKGFNILLPHFSVFVAKELEAYYKDAAKEQALLALSDQLEKIQTNLPWVEFVQSLDLTNCIRLFERKWGDLFNKKLSIDFKTWAKELHGFRNKLAHIGTKDFNFNDTWRALDTAARLCDAFDDQAAEEIRDIIRELRKEEPSEPTNGMNKDGGNQPTLLAKTSGLPSWREIVKPHRDVMEGKYNQSEFAADLAQVIQGKGAYEYRDAVEFFARTYITEGMRDLLAQALKRINGKGGDPVVQLKTAFGGGKTHSMLALYHMLRGKAPIEKMPDLKEKVLDYVGVHSLPRANVAVLVGTALNPTKSRRPINMPGVTINTFWGEMVAQLAESCGRPELYELIKEADKKRVSPGAEVFRQIFDECGSCLVLMDEIVAYARKLYGIEDLPAGRFENFLSFVQEVTEGAKASQNSLVVASIPESDIEIGGDAGRQALDAVEHTFGRVEAVWKPVTAREGYEIVRRRLFASVENESKRDEVCRAFDKLYQENPDDFPVETRDGAYLEQMKACYPIHPEVFDRLYNDWSTLDNFQRTRGVLRLMATVIHELWISNDADPLVMPSSFPLKSNNVHNELTRYLPQEWNGIVDSEVDGKDSTPLREDKSNLQYGQHQAARRIARTIMLGSAPTGNKTVRGLDITRIHLGTVQPTESIFIFNDALNTLRAKLSYLYATPSGDRFWFDTRPTLRKTAEERASKIASSDIEMEIEKRIQKEKLEKPFSGICFLPQSSKDVPDEQKLRLVVLPPSYTHKTGNSDSSARNYALEIVKFRGEQPRLYRNTLAFLAADQDGISQLQQEVRFYLAWQSIERDKEQLNLDASQRRETTNAINGSDETIKARIKETFTWLFVPSTSRSNPSEIQLEESRLFSSAKGTIISAIIEKMKSDETVVETWAPKLLKMELDQLLWKDANGIQVQDLWGKLCQYCYLPRLASYRALEQAILDGVASTDYWGLASDFDGKECSDLRFGEPVRSMSETDWLIKPELAQEQKASASGEENGGTVAPLPLTGGAGGKGPSPSGQGGRPSEGRPEPKPQTRFYLSATINPRRALPDVQQLVEEVIQHLVEDYDCNVEIRLEVQADKQKGFDREIIRTLKENCTTLKVDDFGFDQ